MVTRRCRRGMKSRVSGRSASLRGFLSAVSLAVPTTALTCAPTVHADPVDTTAVVVKVVDGDTVDIRDDVRGRLRIRLLGIDTPETKKPGYTVGPLGQPA